MEAAHPRGNDIYLYLLFEFQSKIDWWMAVRIQVYQGLLWQQIIAEKQLQSGALLPPVLSVVLYNGDPRWKAPTQIAELISLEPDSPLWHWQPQVRYHLLDMGAYPEQDLARRASLATLLFRLEQRPPPEQFEQLINEVVCWFRGHEGFETLRRVFAELVRQAMQSFEAIRPIPHDLVEMQSMLATLGEAWKEQWLAEGKAAGKTEGKVDLLIRLLIKRFGPLEPARRGQISAASQESIETWFDRAIDADDLTAVFEPR